MIYPRITLAIGIAISVAACSPSGNPQLDMCKKITGNLLIGDAEYGEITEVKGRETMQLTLPYTSDGESSEAVCTFAMDHNNDGSYQTSPKSMTLDGMQIGSKDLMKASLASSKVVLKETADETKKQAAEAAEEAKVMAAEAKDKAAEMAADAKDKATELADEAKVKAGEVATQIKESEVVDRAKVMAEDAKDKAKEALLEGTKKIQEKLEN